MIARRSHAAILHAARATRKALLREKNLRRKQSLIHNEVRHLGPDLCSTRSLLSLNRRTHRNAQHRNEKGNNADPNDREFHCLSPFVFLALRGEPCQVLKKANQSFLSSEEASREEAWPLRRRKNVVRLSELPCIPETTCRGELRRQGVERR